MIFEKFDPYEKYRSAILISAAEQYRALKAGQEPDYSKASIVLSKGVGSATKFELHEADVAQAKVNIAARIATRMAILQDTVENAGFILRNMAKAEIALS